MRLGFTNLWAISGPFQTLPMRLALSDDLERLVRTNSRGSSSSYPRPL